MKFIFFIDAYNIIMKYNKLYIYIYIYISISYIVISFD